MLRIVITAKIALATTRIKRFTISFCNRGRAMLKIIFTAPHADITVAVTTDEIPIICAYWGRMNMTPVNNMLLSRVTTEIDVTGFFSIYSGNTGDRDLFST